MRAVPWILLIPVLALAIAAGVYVAKNLEKDLLAEAEARRAVEAELLRKQRQLVVERRTAEDLRARMAELEAEMPELRAALDQARRAAPGARPVAVVRATTGPIEATGEPRPVSPDTAASIESPKPEVPPPCLLAAGDRAEIRIAQVTLETREHNYIVPGVAELIRLEPGPPTKILSGPFEAPLSAAAVQAAAPPGGPRWGLIAAGVATGLLVGLAAGVRLGR